MTNTAQRIKEIEDQIEKALWEYEVHNDLVKALNAYLEAEAKLEALRISADDPAYPEYQRVLSYSLMRQGNILRQLGKPQEALALSEREIKAARASGDEITLARSLMSNGTNLIVAGKIEQGTGLIDEAIVLYKKGNSYDHLQGLGWCWILQADLANAGFMKREPAEVAELATRALELLKPIDNWPGIARAYAARAKAYDLQGDERSAMNDREEQKLAESKIGPGDSSD
jgi:tetratricopeptide (TPR) repeat protein